MGSRYGGLKQLDGLGPNGETIMDYSIFDAIRGGFGKIVFVIRKDFEQDFREKIISKYENHIPVELVFQAIDDLPAGFTCPAERVKPWGTNHAVLMGKDVIKEPFAVINADDFYGKESFEVMAKFLLDVNGQEGKYCMAGYRVGNTLSEHGTVSRGVCATDKMGFLTDVVERTAIENKNGHVVYQDNGVDVEIPFETPVSMNMWGFTPEYFTYAEEAFKAFLTENSQELKAEFYIPTLVNDMIKSGKATCQVLDTTAKWFGVTYADDRQMVVDKIQALVDAGVYPNKLF
jgi:UTP-glucose-1-phosphate uridylyltransferase